MNQKPPQAAPGLTFAQVEDAQRSRHKRWSRGTRPWVITEWTNAMAGEAGEACNVAKKLQRIRDGAPNVSDRTITDEAEAKDALATELADTFCYLQLAAIEEGIDLAAAIRRVFNKVSERNGFPERL